MMIGSRKKPSNFVLQFLFVIGVFYTPTKTDSTSLKTNLDELQVFDTFENQRDSFMAPLPLKLFSAVVLLQELNMEVQSLSEWKLEQFRWLLRFTKRFFL